MIHQPGTGKVCCAPSGSPPNGTLVRFILGWISLTRSDYVFCQFLSTHLVRVAHAQAFTNWNHVWLVTPDPFSSLVFCDMLLQLKSAMEQSSNFHRELHLVCFLGDQYECTTWTQCELSSTQFVKYYQNFQTVWHWSYGNKESSHTALRKTKADCVYFASAKSL